MKTLFVLVSLFFTAQAATIPNTIIINSSPEVFSGSQFSIEFSSSTNNKIDVWENYSKLKSLCGCESTGSPTSEPRQFRDDKPLWSDFGTPDVGACQINISAHKKELEKLKLDVVNSFDDNIKFAKLLYDREGTEPWSASKSCWSK